MNAGWKSPHLAEPAHVGGPAHRMWTAPKNASDKLSFSSYSNVNAFFQIAIFRFFAQRNRYTVQIVG